LAKVRGGKLWAIHGLGKKKKGKKENPEKSGVAGAFQEISGVMEHSAGLLFVAGIRWEKKETGGGWEGKKKRWFTRKERIWWGV